MSIFSHGHDDGANRPQEEAVAPRGTLIVKQPVLFGIADEDVLPALSEASRRGARRVVEIDVREAANRAIESGDWSRVEQALARAFRKHLRPAMEELPTWSLAYFGTAPIPLAMQLGFLTGAWARVDTFLRHHERRDWIWMPPVDAAPEVRVRGVPQGVERAEGDAIIRVSTSVPVDPRETLQIVPEPVAEVDIDLAPAGFDAVVSVQLLERVADAFKEALNAIASLRPGIRTVHVFAAVPVGLAFRMGARISATMHPLVQTYYFKRTVRPPHLPAIALPSLTPARAGVGGQWVANGRERAADAGRAPAPMASLGDVVAGSEQLSGAERREVAEALISAFPDRSSLARLLFYELDESLEAIAAPGNMRATVFELLQYTEAQGYTRRLLDAAGREAPDNPALRALNSRRRP